MPLGSTGKTWLAIGMLMWSDTKIKFFVTVAFYWT